MCLTASFLATGGFVKLFHKIQWFFHNYLGFFKFHDLSMHGTFSWFSRFSMISRACGNPGFSSSSRCHESVCDMWMWHFLILLDLFFNPLYTHGFFLQVRHNKLGIVHCPYLGVSGYNFQNILYFLSEDLCYLYKQCRPRWNAAFCCISSGSSLFANVLVVGFHKYKWL